MAAGSDATGAAPTMTASYSVSVVIFGDDEGMKMDVAEVRAES